MAGPHLDYHQDDAKRLEFHAEYPILSDGRNKTDPHYLVGAQDTPEEKMSVLLGVWKPLSPSEVSPDSKYIYIYSDKRYLQSTFYTNIKTQNIISDSDS